MLSILKTIGVSLVVACLIAGGVFVFKPILMEKRELENRRDEFRADNDRMSEEIDRLKRKQALFSSDPEFVEQVARKANRIRPNEIVFVFPSEPVP